MFDKLSICNTALIRTGNVPADIESDGSPEWLTASDAYETKLPIVLYDHNWGFASDIVTLVRRGDSAHPAYADAFAKPPQCLYVETVWLNGVPTDYQLVANELVMNARGANPSAKIIVTPTPDQWPPLFVETLRLFVMAEIYRGLNEDTGEAEKANAQAWQMLAQARTRADQETPARARFKSRLAAARVLRRGPSIVR